jgi:predicted  nucleic acid-binding Zn-ribbon protein
MDNEKVLDLIEKMYYEMHKDFEVVKGDISGIKEDMKDLKDRQLKIESKLEDARKTIIIGHIQNAEAIKRLETKFDQLADKVENHDLKIQVIEGGKKAL